MRNRNFFLISDQCWLLKCGRLGGKTISAIVLTLPSPLQAFFTTNQLTPKSILFNAIRLATSPVVKGVINFDAGMRDIRALDDISFYDWWAPAFAPNGPQLGVSRVRGYRFVPHPRCRMTT